MNVTLLRLDGLDTAMLAASVCVSEDMPIVPTPDNLSKALMSGHDSLLEHITASFAIEGVSRVTEVQLVRHRMASYAVQSGRYCSRDPRSIIIPDHRLSPSEAYRFGDELRIVDECMMSRGVPPEDRRYLYPQGTRTNIVMTCNLRELSHMCGLRGCSRAQWEIRQLFGAIANVVGVKLGVDLADYRGLYHELLRRLKPQCEQMGYCPEARTCGRVPSLKDLQGAYDMMRKDPSGHRQPSSPLCRGEDMEQEGYHGDD